jgi:hypothetical protein
VGLVVSTLKSQSLPRWLGGFGKGQREAEEVSSGGDHCRPPTFLSPNLQLSDPQPNEQYNTITITIVATVPVLPRKLVREGEFFAFGYFSIFTPLLAGLLR